MKAPVFAATLVDLVKHIYMSYVDSSKQPVTPMSDAVRVDTSGTVLYRLEYQRETLCVVTNVNTCLLI